MWSNYGDAPRGDLPLARHKGVACAPLITLANETKSRSCTRVDAGDKDGPELPWKEHSAWVRDCVRELPRKRKALLLL